MQNIIIVLFTNFCITVSRKQTINYKNSKIFPTARGIAQTEYVSYLDNSSTELIAYKSNL